MLRPESIALELLEHKVDALKADRAVSGGVSSVWELYHHVSKLAAYLTDEERDRFHGVTDRLKGSGEKPASRSSKKVDFDLVLIDDVPLNASAVRPAFAPPEASPQVAAEQRILQKLAREVWWGEVEDVIQELAARFRAEKTRASARLLYALSRNLELTLKNTREKPKLTLSGFAVREPVPERLDPLVSLNNLDNLTELVREIVETVVGIADGQGAYARLELPRGQALAYVKKMALQIARDPYAGQLSALPHKGPSSAQFRLAMQELAREPLREDERQAQLRALEQRLKHALVLERQQRESHQQDVSAYVQAAEAFFDRLERFLPQRVGGEAGEPQLKGGVLFAENRALRLSSVAPDAKSVTVRLKGPTRFALCGLEMAVTGSGRMQALAIGDQSYPLQPRLKMDLERHSVLALLQENYLHLRVTDTGRPLAALVAEALLIYTVLCSSRSAELLTVLRVAGTVAAGEPQEIILQALERLKAVSSRAPNRRTVIEGMLRGAAKAKGFALPENLVLTLVNRFHAAITATQGDLPQVLASADAASDVHALGDDPLSLSIGGQPVTVRKYRRRSGDAAGSVVVMLPGRVIGSFKSAMVRSFPGGVLLCAASHNELATLFFEGAKIDEGMLTQA